MEQVCQSGRLDGSGLAENMSDTRWAQYLRYWQQLTAATSMQQQQHPLQSRTPRPRNWMHFKIGRSGFALGAKVIVLRKNLIWAELFIKGDRAFAYFQELARDREIIDAAVEHQDELEWQELPASQGMVRCRSLSSRCRCDKRSGLARTACLACC